MSRHNLKYRTYDQLLSEVKSDFESYNLEDLIKPHNFIKIAKKVNYDLGLRIQKTKNVVLEVSNGKARLPLDFQYVNFMYILGHYKTVTPVVQGTHVESVNLSAPTYHPGTKDIEICALPPACPEPEPLCPDPCQSPEPCGCNTCNCDTWLNCKGDTMKLIQKIKYETREWTEFYRVRLVDAGNIYTEGYCPNLKWQSSNTAFIKGDYIFTSFKEGTLYLNYQGMMENENGEIIVLDHDGINDYYEYAIKKRLIEILLANQESVNQNFIQLIYGEYKEARIYARGIVNTPDFAEMKAVWDMNRKAMYNKYYRMFQ